MKLIKLRVLKFFNSTKDVLERRRGDQVRKMILAHREWMSDTMLSILFNIDLILIGVNCILDQLTHSDNQEGVKIDKL